MKIRCGETSVKIEEYSQFLGQRARKGTIDEWVNQRGRLQDRPAIGSASRERPFRWATRGPRICLIGRPIARPNRTCGGVWGSHAAPAATGAGAGVARGERAGVYTCE